jgi:hypothetical protein
LPIEQEVLPDRTHDYAARFTNAIDSRSRDRLFFIKETLQITTTLHNPHNQ